MSFFFLLCLFPFPGLLQLSAVAASVVFVNGHPHGPQDPAGNREHMLRHARHFSSSARRLADFSHAVVGGGVVGLAVASELAKQGHKVVLLEKNTQLGQETSSRNSEVIHAGLYYPKDSLKTQLCIEGKNLLYSEAQAAGVEMQRVGKWIVAQTDYDDAFIENIHYKAKDLGVKTELIPTYKAQFIEPAIDVKRGVLVSPTTGIVSAHSLMLYLQTQFENNSGEIALGSQVSAIEKLHSGYELTVDTTVGEQESTTITVDNVVNSAGLHADKIANLILPEERHVKLFYAKGTYFSFAPSFPEVRRLIYPTPHRKLKGLGTHLTLSLDGQIKFGPDVEWVDSPYDLKPSAHKQNEAYQEIVKYFPHCLPDDISPSYAGIRPKLAGPDSKEDFTDFVIREEEEFPGFVNLLGIESPGLTSSMAIGKYVANIYK